MLTRTTTALLEGLLEQSNDETWREFDARYRPIIVAFARRVGLGETDAADIAQETLLRFVREYRAGKYNRDRGRLRSWIIGITKHCVGDLRQRHAKRREQRGMSAISDWPDEDELTKIWEAECRRAILQEGLRELREDTKMDPRTIQTFEMLAVHEKSTADVAQAMGVTNNDVYLAKHRCLARLRTILTGLNEAYEVA